MSTLVEKAVEALKERGYDASITTLHKAGADYEAVIIKEEGINMTPAIPTHYLISKDEDSMADEILVFYERNKLTHSIDTEKIVSREHIQANIIPILAKKAPAEAVSRKYLDLDVYLKIKVNVDEFEQSFSAFDVMEGFLDMVGITEDEAFSWALENMQQDTSVASIADIMRQNRASNPLSQDYMSDEEFEILLSVAENGPLEYVVTNSFKHYGAAGLLNFEVFKEICNREETDKLMIIPSSIHELIVIAHPDDADEDFTNMINRVNQEDLIPGEVLSDHPYYYDLSTNNVYDSNPWLHEEPNSRETAAAKLLAGAFTNR